MIRMLMLFCTAPLLAGSAASAQVLNPNDLKWGPAPSGLPAGAEVAVLSGDPAKPGMFTIRLRTPAGYAVPPHHHPTPELVTVIEGGMLYGMGETADRAEAASLSVGGYFVAAPNMNHYVFTGSAPTIVQITSHGPFEIIYVNPADDPRKGKPAERGR